MVNENAGKKYTPKPFYSRKLVRSVLRAKIYGEKYGNVSRRMSYAFRTLKSMKAVQVEE